MKPFQDVCGEISRKAYTSRRVNRKGKVIFSDVEASRCEVRIWFEPSLKDGVFIGRCPVATHNPVYRTQTPSKW